MTNQINIFILLFGSLQGFLLSLWLFRNQRQRASHVYLATLLVVVGIQLTLKVITKAWLMHHMHFAYQLSYKLPFLIGPLLFLYVNARVGKAFVKRDLLHFIPFMGFMAMVGLMMKGTWPHAWEIHPYFDAGLKVVSLLVYGVLSIRLAGDRFRSFILFVVVAEAIISVTLALMYMYYGRFPDVRLLFVVLTGLIYWISYKVIAEPDLLMETHQVPSARFALFRKDKYAHSSLKPEESARIEAAIRTLLVSDKLFLDSSISIDILAQKLHTSRHHLSQVFNERLKRTYSEFVAELRLTEARTRLSDPRNNRFTIAAVALDSGFNSVSGFNDLFKKHFGVTPSQFRDEQMKKMSA